MNEELEYPNVLIVNEQPETPEEMIESYLAQIIEHKNDHEELLFILQDFFDDISTWTDKQHLINQAKITLQQLEDLDMLTNFNYIDEEDD